jgi:hypothetical protein
MFLEPVAFWIPPAKLGPGALRWFDRVGAASFSISVPQIQEGMIRGRGFT